MVLFAAILVLGLLISNISANELEVILEDADHDLIEDVIVFDGPNVVTASRPQISSSLTHPGTVPQLLPNFTGPKLPNPETVPCDVARLKCAFRSGCGLALQNYALGCLDLVQGKSHICNNHCRHSLIALVSTTEGKRLMKVKIKILLVISFC